MARFLGAQRESASALLATVAKSPNKKGGEAVWALPALFFFASHITFYKTDFVIPTQGVISSVAEKSQEGAARNLVKAFRTGSLTIHNLPGTVDSKFLFHRL